MENLNQKESLRTYLYSIMIGICLLLLLVSAFLYSKFYNIEILASLDFSKINLSAADNQNIQILNSLGLFVFPPLIYSILKKKEIYSFYLLNKTINIKVFLILLSIIIISFPFLTFTENVLRSIPFPKSIKDFADTIDYQHTEAMKQFLVFDTFFQFLKIFFIISILAGISEEIFFRGLTMNVLLSKIKNYHIIIWLQGILFGLIHFNFYQSFALIFIGVGFGYIAYFYKNLWLTILLHFVNNGVQIILYYLYYQKIININMDASPNIPWYLATISFGLAALGIYSLKNTIKIQQ